MREEKKIKKQEMTSSVLMGFLIGIMIYGFINKGFSIIHIGIPAVLLFAIFRNLQKLKKYLKMVQSEIMTKR